MQAYIFANLHKQIPFVNPRFHNLREFFGSRTILHAHLITREVSCLTLYDVSMNGVVSMLLVRNVA